MIPTLFLQGGSHARVVLAGGAGGGDWLLPRLSGPVHGVHRLGGTIHSVGGVRAKRDVRRGVRGGGYVIARNSTCSRSASACSRGRSRRRSSARGRSAARPGRNNAGRCANSAPPARVRPPRADGS